MEHLYLKLQNTGDIPYNKIDEKVRNLVAVLQHLGLYPDSSCEGHVDRDEHRHPQVGFKLDPNSLVFAKTDRLLAAYNNDKKIKWWRNQNRPTKKLMPITYAEMCSRCYGNKAIPTSQDKLMELQISAEDLAVFLFSA